VPSVAIPTREVIRDSDTSGGRPVAIENSADRAIEISVDASRVSQGERLLRVGARSAAAASLFRDREGDVKPPVPGPAVAFPSALHDRFGRVEGLSQINRHLSPDVDPRSRAKH
jgi:hypothetical protein